MSPDSNKDVSLSDDQQAKNQYERLQERLEEYTEDDIVEVERLEDADNLGEIPTEEIYRLSDQDANELLSFYLTTAAEIEQESALIINAEIFDWGMKREGSFDFIMGNFTQSDREDMLFYLGLIDEGLKGELARVRKRRNELAHTNQHDEIEDINRVKNSLKRAENAKSKLYAIYHELELELGQPD